MKTVSRDSCISSPYRKPDTVLTLVNRHKPVRKFTCHFESTFLAYGKAPSFYRQHVSIVLDHVYEPFPSFVQLMLPWKRVLLLYYSLVPT